MIKILLFILCLGTATSGHAKLIQILHTNDLHSMFKGTRSGMGGYARIKTLFEELKAKAALNSIPTLVLDAGDFGEGSSFYFSNQGVDSLRALDLLGIDVTVLGNHDYILGGKELSRQIKAANLNATILSANLQGKRLMGLHDLMPDYVDHQIEGMKIRIFGLTTPEAHFQYPLLPTGFIAGSHKAGVKMATKSQRDGVDLLIALTHIGLEKDTTLASHTRSIDLIVGGHNHFRLEQPKYVSNLDGELVPIVQTGAHGVAVGSILIDMQGNGENKIIDYKLYDVSQNIPEDTEIRSFVEAAEVNRERYFNRSWEEVIGFSEITLTGLHEGLIRNGNSCWSRHIARLTKDTAGTELGIQFDIFQGEEIQPGPITYGDLIDNFPHFRTWGDQGWAISKAKISGFWLKKMIGILSKMEEPVSLTIDGLESANSSLVFTPFKIGVHSLESAHINGYPILENKKYTVALPSEIPYSFGKFGHALRNIILKDVEYLKNADYWPLLEDYIKRNSPLGCLKD